MKNPRSILYLGVCLMVIGGIGLPFLMVIQLLESTFFLNFFSWGLSSLGLTLGMIGFTLYSNILKK